MSNTSTAARTYAIDPSHSSAHFAVRHLMISKVRGTFKTVTGTVELPETGAVPLAVDVSIDAASINTGDDQRDGHLKSADFFEVEKYPTLTFKSTTITPVDAESFEVTGDLQIHGVTNPLTTRVTISGEGKDPYGNERIAYEASFKVNRKAHSLTFNIPLDAGGVAIGDEIDVQLDFETIRQAG